MGMIVSTPTITPRIPRSAVSRPARIALSDTSTNATASASWPARPMNWEVASSELLVISCAASTVRGPARKSVTAALLANAPSAVETALRMAPTSAIGIATRGSSGRRARVAAARKVSAQPSATRPMARTTPPASSVVACSSKNS